MDKMVSIITSTKREHMLEQVIDNFCRQTVTEKELIIIINNNAILLEKWQSRIESIKNIRVYQLDEKKTLGECLNYGANLAQYGVLAKFDDDDYYSPTYLVNSLRALKETEASVVGKASIFVYFKKDRLLSLFRPRMNHLFLKSKKVFLAGGTLVFQRELLEKVQFCDLNTGEDIQFQKDCLDRKFSIFADDFYDYTLIRYDDKHEHSWQVVDERFQKQCKTIAVTDSFKEYVWRGM